ncbi:hypothetical protein SISSUDRAFT_1061085 [Sistotremastrum suecicum HHB10207 ss-3]|uniref:Dynactin subunit 4 n=1 Tax=Sistotremastrum suecicum HHB10207 ss-3 TaxID=1314776 RepID=A0A166EDX6_9AGAM|nr:hypothetical protein SISSUDRAFT_1061085 [Sistotremastrum suecicum HHB10207 ss-3]
MACSVLFHCPCLNPPTDPPPPPSQASSSTSNHPLHTLFFCEECDAIRCDRCVSVEVSAYHCPNCLFEVPSASVRAEKNRCARNCFQCPRCTNTLSVVPSDPPGLTWDTQSSSISLGAINEPPFLLFCNFCRWDSSELGIKFDKPTGLAAQLQRHEDSAPEMLEFERLKEHFATYLRAQQSSSSTSQQSQPHHRAHHTSLTAATAAASSALARDIPGVSKHRRKDKDRGAGIDKEELPIYKSRIESASLGTLGLGADEEDVEFLKKLDTENGIEDVARLEQRWTGSWQGSIHSRDLRPLRMPLHSKKSKRCPVCRHILIKPEQKTQSVRYKIKLVAANYLPSIVPLFPSLTPQGLTAAQKKALSTKGSTMSVDEGIDHPLVSMHAGRTYPFQLAFTNPLYDPIHVKLSVQRQSLPSTSSSGTTDSGSTKKVPPNFAINLPTSSFPISAYAEAWEYEDEDEEEMLLDDEALAIGGSGISSSNNTGGRKSKGGSSSANIGVIERKANVTVVGGEVVVGKEGRGDVKFNMMVSYTYRSDEPSQTTGSKGEGKTKTTTSEMKTFSFWVVVHLGSIIVREREKDRDRERGSEESLREG